MSITMRSIPTTPLAGISTTNPSHLFITPGTPVSPKAQTSVRVSLLKGHIKLEIVR